MKNKKIKLLKMRFAYDMSTKKNFFYFLILHLFLIILIIIIPNAVFLILLIYFIKVSLSPIEIILSFFSYNGPIFLSLYLVYERRLNTRENEKDDYNIDFCANYFYDKSDFLQNIKWDKDIDKYRCLYWVYDSKYTSNGFQYPSCYGFAIRIANLEYSIISDIRLTSAYYINSDNDFTELCICGKTVKTDTVLNYREHLIDFIMLDKKLKITRYDNSFVLLVYKFITSNGNKFYYFFGIKFSKIGIQQKYLLLSKRVYDVMFKKNNFCEADIFDIYSKFN